jgi:hypothetical protein
MTKLAVVHLALAFALAACHHDHHHAVSPPPEAAAAAPLTEAAIAIPIAPGKTQAWEAALHELTGPRYSEYDTSRRRFGLTSQTTFLQKTPMGDFALIHMTGADVHASFHAMSTSQDPWDVKWRELTQSLHGVDFAKGERVTPVVEPLYSMDSGAGGTPFMFLAPLGEDGAAKLRALVPELATTRHADYVHARAALGIHREAVFLETSAQGTAAVFYWTADDPVAALRAFAASRDPFDTWLRDQLAGVHPIPMDAIVQIASANTLVGQYPH